MLFNPGPGEKIFTFDSDEIWNELLPPDPGYSIYAPVQHNGSRISVPLCPGALRILIKNAPNPALPRCSGEECHTPAWQIKKIEKMQMSLKGPTYFKKLSCSGALPESGNYTELDKSFSGFLTLESSIELSRSGDALLIFENIEHAAQLKVNGKDAGIRGSSPWIFKTSLKKGRNKLELRIASSAGNEFFRCFKEELEPAGYKNTYANRFCKYERDDEKCGITGNLKIVFLEEAL